MSQIWSQSWNGSWTLYEVDQNGDLHKVAGPVDAPPNDGIPRDDGSNIVPQEFQQTIGGAGGGNWWDMSIFADLTGGTSAIGGDAFNFGTGFMGFGVGSGPQLPKLPWLWILAGVAIVVVAVSARR